MTSRHNNQFLTALTTMFGSSPVPLKVCILGLVAIMLFVVFERVSEVASALLLAFGTLALFVGLVLAVNRG